MILKGPLSNISGLSGYELSIRYVMHNVDHLETSFESIHTYELEQNTSSLTIPFNASTPSVYALYLTSKDSAQDTNAQQSRRFVLVDNFSNLVTNSTFNIIPISASVDTGYEWQTNTGPIELTWINHFYNNWHVSNNLLLPIVSDPDETITGIFEQETGELPVSGTPNVDGIVNFMYRFKQISNDSEQQTRFTNVPYPLNESLLLDIPLSDGDSLLIYIKAIDIMNHTLVDYISLNIDSSPPIIEEMCLITGNHTVCGAYLVHSARDFESIKLLFKCKDEHRYM